MPLVAIVAVPGLDFYGELLGVCTVEVNCDPVDCVLHFVKRLVTVNEVQSFAGVLETVTEELRLRFSAGRFNGMLGLLRTWVQERYGDAFGVGPVALASNELLTDLLPATPLVVGPVSHLNFSIVPDANQTPITYLPAGTSGSPPGQLHDHATTTGPDLRRCAPPGS